MKKIILLALVLLITNIPLAFSNINKVESSIDFRKNKLCKTWYVTEAFETREDRPKRDRTKKAQGSIFIFNKDFTFSLEDKSRRNEKPQTGTWKESGKNSISIIMEGTELDFEIKQLTRKSLYLVGANQERNDRIIHIKFSSSFVKPMKEKELSYDDLEVMEEIEITEDVVESAEAVEETVDVDRNRNSPRYATAEEVVNNPNKVYEVQEIKESKKILGKAIKKLDEPQEKQLIDLSKFWNIDKVEAIKNNSIEDITRELERTQIILNKDYSSSLIEVTKGVYSVQMGKWKLTKDKKIEVKLEKETRTFLIIESSPNILILKEQGGKNYKYYLISK